jgi:hypothetical protein
MRPSALAAFVFLLLPACSPIAVTPSSRTLVMSSAIEPVTGQDVQIDVARIGTLWGPELVGGNGRIRRTLQPGLVAEVDGGILHLTNDGSGGNRNAFTGRVGLVRHLREGLAVGAGAGGGMSATAGTWGAIDVNGVFSGTHRYFRPVLGGAVGYSVPLEDKTFTVTEEDGTRTTLQLPRNRFAQVNLGFEIGPRDTAFLIGGSLIKFWMDETSVVSDEDDYDHEMGFLALGVGLRIASH